MTALIVLNGEPDEKIFEFANDSKLMQNIYCADGGANFLYNNGIIPKVIMGDMDSIAPNVKKFYEEKNCEFVVFPSEKDQTDGEIIAERAAHDGASTAIILCAAGGRIDHFLGNIQILYRLAKKNISTKMVSIDSTIYMLNKDTIINGKKGQTVSVIPFEDNTVISLKGFGYNLDKAKIERDTSIGISNYLSDESAFISIHSGCALVILIN